MSVSLPVPRRNVYFALLGDSAQRRRMVLVLLLMAAASATEGIGLVLAVPLIAALNGNGGSMILQWPTRILPSIGSAHTLSSLLAAFIVLVTLRALLMLARTLVAEQLQIDVVDGLRSRAWRALLAMDWKMLARQHRSDHASLLISDINRAGFALQQALAAAAMLTLVALALAGLALSPRAAFGALLAGSIVLAAFAPLRRLARTLGQDLGQAYASVHGSLGEGLGALREIKSLGGEARAAVQLDQGVARLRIAQLSFTRAQSIGQGALQVGGAAALASLIWLAVARWTIPAAVLLPLIAVFVRAVPLLGALQDAWLQWAHARPAITATLALIDSAEAAREPIDTAATAPTLTHELRLSGAGVQFAGAERAALVAIDLVIPAKQMVALLGPSGSGKSTLADLLGGLISPDSGTLSIDGVVLTAGVRRAWREQVAYVHQEPVLLAASLRDNLRWAVPEASDAALETALRAAAAEFAFALPQGLETLLGDGGRTLSGGERQRLMLARALLRRPALLILDEATSALDPANEGLIVQALERLKGTLTVLVIAHRGALAEVADQTYTLANGRLIS
jgi:ATP-binding cassette subfamily C protein